MAQTEPQWSTPAETQLADPLLEEVRRVIERVLIKRRLSGEPVDGDTLLVSAEQATAIKPIIDHLRGREDHG